MFVKDIYAGALTLLSKLLEYFCYNILRINIFLKETFADFKKHQRRKYVYIDKLFFFLFLVYQFQTKIAVLNKTLMGWKYWSYFTFDLHFSQNFLKTFRKFIVNKQKYKNSFTLKTSENWPVNFGLLCGPACGRPYVIYNFTASTLVRYRIIFLTKQTKNA